MKLKRLFVTMAFFCRTARDKIKRLNGRVL
nr:MAG TPA: hypothetical protein [Caudoviricetes sp.]